MNGVLCAQDFSRDEFVGMVHDASWPFDSLMMLLAPTHEPRFDFYSYDEELLQASEQGRIFNPEGEFKWRRVGDCLRTVYLGYTPPVMDLIDHSEKLNDLSTEYEELVLWGERRDLENEWIAQQVPHRFRYPVSGMDFPRGRVALVVEHWTDSSGIRRFSRYYSLKEIEGEKHASR